MAWQNIVLPVQAAVVWVFLVAVGLAVALNDRGHPWLAVTAYGLGIAPIVVGITYLIVRWLA